MNKRYFGLGAVAGAVALVLAAPGVMAADSKAVIYKGNGHKYQRIDQSFDTWTEARDYCKSKGGYLATITSQGEQNFIATNIPVPKFWQMGWLGGSSMNSTNSWQWVTTGEKFGYQNWAGDPGAGGSFALMEGNYTWGAYSATYNTSFVGAGVGALCEWNGAAIAIFPPSGGLNVGTSFDASITVMGNASDLKGGKFQVTLNKVDVTGDCLPIEGLLDTAGAPDIGQVLRCPALSSKLLQPGQNTLVATFSDAKKRKSTDIANWTVYPTAIFATTP
jgi:hypothetical protein